jgi:uncharacterized circularly permuted ATP-grasp superfamily protein/uncharacterized alpha-E superfamily protein
MPSFLANYCNGARFDEMLTPDGRVRPHWQPLLELLAGMGPQLIERLRLKCQQLLRESGVTYNLHGSGTEPAHPWLLDILPYLISSADWAFLKQGLEQRARLLGMLLADLLGPQIVLRERVIPAELIFSHPAWHPALHALPLPTGHSLAFSSVDLARRDDGRFYVLSDGIQAPSGAGYALENRLILSRAFREPFRRFHIHRLLPFFRTLRTNLENLAIANRADPHIVLLAPGLDSDTHFEQVFLANYLGLTLTQGEDLTVRNGRVALKTLDGLRGVDCILRRVPDLETDSLELNESSIMGVVGLVQAVRQGRVRIINPLGGGVLENQGLHAYMQPICRHFLAQDLILPSLPTWWWGDPEHRRIVGDQLWNKVIKPIFPRHDQPPLFGSWMNTAARADMMAKLEANPYAYVVQEPFAPATMPVFTETGVEAHTMVLRTFMTGERDTIDLMPGGVARYSLAAPGMPAKPGISKGAWVLSETPVEWTHRIRHLQPIETAPLMGELPSRTAENLFWIGRYTERAENTIRLARVLVLLVMEETGLADAQRIHCMNTLYKAMAHLTGSPSLSSAHKPYQDPLASLEKRLLTALCAPEQAGSVSNALSALIRSAQGVREYFSLFTWQVIQDLSKGSEQLQKILTSRSGGGELDEVLKQSEHLITALMAFSGLTMESMTRGQGWQFLNTGRRLERALFLAGVMNHTLVHKINGDYESAVLEQLLTITDSLLTFRRRYRARLEIRQSLELILLDETNPRALAYQLVGLDNHVDYLARARRQPAYRAPEGRVTLEALSLLRLAQPGQLALISHDHRPNLEKLLNQLETLLPLFSTTLTNSYFQHSPNSRQLAPIF